MDPGGSRRVELKAFEKPAKANEKPTKANEVKPLKLAIRFEIKLEESTDEKCPEISYTDLLLKHERKRKRTNSTSLSSGVNPDDPFGDDDEDNMEALAKRMEEKYGKSYGGGGRNKLLDLGDGYDTEDSFIDNEEAYDELVPSTLTTKHGGFYINSGVLDFKEVSDDEILSEDEVRKTLKKNKRNMNTISSGSDDENEGEKQAEPIKKKKKRKTLSTGSQDSMDSRKSLLVKKKKKILTKEEANKERLKKKKLLQKKKLVERAQLTLTDKELKQKSKLYDSIIDDVIKSNNNAATPMKSPPVVRKTVENEPAVNKTTTLDAAKPKESKPEAPKPENKEPVKLPDNMTETCVGFIDDLKQIAAKCTEEKGKFFTPEVNLKLISLDNEVRQIGSVVSRNNVYSHLSSYLPINRETLMKRMKLLRQKELTDRLQEPIDKLKQAVNEVMPAQIEKYNAELQARVNNKQDDVEKLREDSQDSDDEGLSQTQPPSANTSVISAPDGSSTNPAAASTSSTTNGSGEDKKKEKTSPVFRKKFDWNDKVRNCLCDVITVKMKSFDVLKVKGQTPEEFIKEFLENEIRSLWPKGWMQSRVLYKESKAAHVKWTNPNQIPVKPPAVKKPVLIANAMKMAASMSSTSKSAPQSAGGSVSNVKPGESLLSKAITSTSSKFTVSSIQDVSTMQKGTSAAGEKSQGAQGMLKALSITSSSAGSHIGMRTAIKPLTVSMPESAKSLQHSLIKPRLITTTTVSSTKTSQTVALSGGNKLLQGTTVRTTDSGEKLVMDGEKVIGKLVLNTSSNSSASQSSKKAPSSAPSTPVTERKEIITITDSPFIDPTEATEPKAKSTPLRTTTVPTTTLKSLTPSRPSGSATTPSKSPGNAAAGTKATIASTSAPDDDVKMITLPESQPSKHSVSLPEAADQAAIQQAKRRQFAAKRQKMIAQSQQATANVVYQTAHALQQQHLAASIVSQQAMLQHKKYADNLITQQKIAKQQQIAAIVQEQKVQANMAAQQRIAQHQKIAEQQKQHKQQAMLQSAKQHIAQQQQAVKQREIAVARVQQQRIAAHQLAGNTSASATNRESTTVLYSPRAIASPPIRASTPSGSQSIRLGTGSYSFSTSSSPATPTAATTASASTTAGTSNPGLTISWPSGLQQPSLSPAQMAAEYRRTLEVRRQLENMKK